jgi:hypothetical protein
MNKIATKEKTKKNRPGVLTPKEAWYLGLMHTDFTKPISADSIKEAKKMAKCFALLEYWDTDICSQAENGEAEKGLTKTQIAKVVKSIEKYFHDTNNSPSYEQIDEYIKAARHG